jgi:branched-chain amino acid transport system permease protein
MVIIGGAANNTGVALGALSFTFLFKAVDQVKFQFQSYIPFDVNWFEYLLFASLLILILVFRPGGILPEKSSLTLPRQTVTMIMEQNTGPIRKASEEPPANLVPDEKDAAAQHGSDLPDG